MKSLKHLPLVCLLTLINTVGKSQLLTENFNTGFPAGWMQNPANTWSLSPNLGTSGSSCAIIEEVTSNTLTASLRTPTLNLNSVSNLTVSFKAAVVGNNFIIPNVALSYDAGSGTQFVARWGSGFSSNTTYTITGGYDYMTPLEAIHVNWVNCTQTISAISGSAASIVFDAELVNGGYVLIDDVAIAGIVTTTATTGLKTNEPTVPVVLFPNPVPNKKVKVEGTGITALFISDNLGRTWQVDGLKTGNNTIEADLQQFPGGIYYLTVVTNSQASTCKKIILE